MLTTDEARAEVHQILTLAGVTFTPIYSGEQKNVFGDSRPMDKWQAVFHRGERGEAVEFEFFAGLGLRQQPAWGPKLPMYDNGPQPRQGTLMHEKWKALAKPRDPHAADILQSLLMDASAVGQSFDSWCDEFGHDADSLKALAIYEAGQKNTDKLRRFFTSEQIAAFTVALENY